MTRDPARPDLNGHRAVKERICYQCGGALLDETGTHSEMHFESARHSFAAAVCNSCRRWINQQAETAEATPRRRAR